MLYTNSRKIINWKPNEKKLIVPKLSKSNINGNYDITNAKNFTSKFSTARPYKHYRKQLIPYYNTKSSKKISLDNINLSTNSYINETNSLFNPCNNEVSLNYIVDFTLDKPAPCLGTKINNVCKGGNTNVRFRRANTNISSNYYQTNKSYLHNRCKRFEQKSTIGENINDNDYKMTSCNETNCKTIYKPNNKNFSKQGAVQSSTRLLRLKVNTINKNGASFKSAYGRQTANAGAYLNSISDSNINYNKSKNTSLSICRDYPLNLRNTHKNKISC